MKMYNNKLHTLYVIIKMIRFRFLGFLMITIFNEDLLFLVKKVYIVEALFFGARWAISQNKLTKLSFL